AAHYVGGHGSAALHQRFGQRVAAPWGPDCVAGAGEDGSRNLSCAAMDTREWLGLEPTHNPNRWYLPVVPGISTGGGFLFGGCGLGAAISALEGTTGRPVVWATAQYLSFARPGSILDIDVTIAVEGRQTTQA